MEIKITFSHSDLVEAGSKWLTKTIGARFTLNEFRAATTYGEEPDVIGWKSGFSILIECKTSRADFLADRKKLFRNYPDLGMGNYRLYLCPTGLIKPEEVPEPWGLLYYDGKKIERIICWKGNIIDDFEKLRKQEANYKAEVAMLVSKIARK